MVQVVQRPMPGGAEVLRVAEVSLADPGPGQVRLRHHAVGVNFVDIYQRQGLYPMVGAPPVLGMEGAGEIEAIGEGVPDLAIGDRVAWAGPPNGGYSQAMLIDAQRVLRLPDAISFETAGGAMLRGVTTHMVLRRVAALQAGQTILIHAAAGGLGLVMAQWAQRLGARVLGTVGSQAKAELAAAHGVEQPIVTATEDFVAAVPRLTDGRGVDVVADGIGGDTLTRSLDCLAPFGMLVSVGQASGLLPPMAIGDLGPKRSISLARPSSFAYCRDLKAYRAAAEETLSLIANGLSITVGARFALSDAAQAHRAMEGRQTSGSVILVS